jgi:hypothetical protein
LFAATCSDPELPEIYLFRTYKGKSLEETSIHGTFGTRTDEDLDVRLVDALLATSAAPSKSTIVWFFITVSFGTKVDHQTSV